MVLVTIPMMERQGTRTVRLILVEKREFPRLLSSPVGGSLRDRKYEASPTCVLTKLPTEDVACRSSRNVSDKLDLGSVPIGEEFLDTSEILQPRRTLTTCLTSLWTPTPGSCDRRTPRSTFG
ncbi:uncharacterized protein LOC114940730 [Nylanderia fulva]|uniref:uncharacterized protein LOC114940730 n=1 Tax=Nylanderia fulva TaxID=613905 RepID=UPI0010FB5505|nr:uncharacterized protein LOC114940730 [Nylanderia fulva]